uniref:SANT domain-containing protein n=1 Tax=Kalanchoe fedtschenkoi TaxID=63787 RepID=A0A7N0TLZ5_KALFE
MPPGPLPWDPKEYFKAGSRSLTASRELTLSGSPKVHKRPVEGNEALIKTVRLDHELLQPSDEVLEDAGAFQLRKRLCISSAVDENCSSNSGVSGSQKDMKLDGSADVLAEGACNASLSHSLRMPHQESTSISEGRVLEVITDQKLADGIQHHHDPNGYSLRLDCKPIRWPLSGSFSSHESELSQSSSSKSVPVEFSCSRIRLPLENRKSYQSATEDTITCVTPTTPSEDMSPWKRPRLRWGEGLAKFEKTKSSGPNDMPTKSDPVSVISAQISYTASLVTLPSTACNSSPESEEKSTSKAVMADSRSGVTRTMFSECSNHLGSTLFNLETLDLSVTNHTVPSLIEVINYDNQCSSDRSFRSCSAMSDLLLLKSTILQAIDMTESQVDLLENELKSFDDECGCNDLRFLPSDAPTSKFIKEFGKVQEGASGMSCGHALPSNSSTKLFTLKVPLDSGNSGLKADMDSPGTVTSKLVELSTFTEPHVENGTRNDVDRCFDLDASCFPQEIQKTSKFTSQEGRKSNFCVDAFVGNNNSELVSSDDHWHMSLDETEQLIDSIRASNKESADKASEQFNGVFPVAERIQGDSVEEGCSGDLFIREILIRKKKALRFKEHAVILKWKALHSTWKDDKRLLSVRTHRPKAQKQWEMFSQTAQNNNPSVNSNSLHDTNSSLNMGKLPFVSHMKHCRSVLKMPALILDDDERRMCRFLSRNGLVEDPCAVEKERSMINVWTSEERDIFRDKLASLGKDFRNIASFLDYKTTADCVEFYYKNHKSGSFANTVEKQERRMLDNSLYCNTYLVTSGKKWDRNMNTASLDILGAASEIMARNSESKEKKKKNSCNILLHGLGCIRRPPKDSLISDRPSDFRLAEYEIGTTDSEILPGACGSASSEAVSSCLTSSVNQEEGHRNGISKTLSIISEPLSIPEDMQTDDYETCSEESSCELDVGYWTDREKSVFVSSVKSYGKDFYKISGCIGTKSKDQCKSFYSKARKCLGLDVELPDNDHEQQSVIDDSNGDGSIAVFTSTLEAVSDTGSYKLNQRVDEDLSLYASVTSNVDSLSPDASMKLRTCHDQLKDKKGSLVLPSAEAKVEGDSVDRSAPDPDKLCVCNKSAVSTDTDAQASANKSVDISPSLPFVVHQVSSFAQVEKEKCSMEPPLLHNQCGKTDTSRGSFQNIVSYFTGDAGTGKAPRKYSIDDRTFEFDASAPRHLYMSKGSVGTETSQDSVLHHTSFGRSNSTPMYTAALPTPMVPFEKNSVGEMQEHFQRSHYVGNHLLNPECAPSDKFSVSHNFEKEKEKKGLAWNLNFEDSTVSRDSNSDSENRLQQYTCIPQGGYIQKCNSLNSNCSINDFPYFKNLVGPKKQGKQGNIKLFGQVLIPPTAPESHFDSDLMEESKFTQFAQLNGAQIDMGPSNQHDMFSGNENLPVRCFWDGRRMQNAPLLASRPILLSHDASSSSILDCKPLQTSAVPNVNAPPNAGSIFGNSLNRCTMPRL